MREEFEKAIPVPEGVFWVESSKNYMTTSHHFSCLEYRGAWKGWQAARRTPVEVHDLADEWSAAPTKQCAASGGHSDCPRSALPDSQYCAEHSQPRRSPWSN